MTDSKFVVLVLDGLRPDLITPDLMPNLVAFRDSAAVLTGSRAQYPTQTRVNKVSFATGTTPRHHGIHFNKIFNPDLRADSFIDLGDASDVRNATAMGGLITSPSVGMILSQAGRKFALIHCRASGAPFLLNYRSEEHGQEHLSLAGYPFTTRKAAELVENRLGPMPSPKGVEHARSRFALRAFTAVSAASICAIGRGSCCTTWPDGCSGKTGAAACFPTTRTVSRALSRAPFRNGSPR